MSFSSEPSSRPASTLPRQDTATTMSSFSTSCSNLDTSETTLSNASSLRRQTKQNNKTKRKRSTEHYAAFGDEKTLRTLKVHYYPEGNWGWVVVVVGVLVQTFNHGLHLSHGMLTLKLLDVFGSTINAGDYKLIDSVKRRN